MRKIIDYRLLAASELDYLNSDVNEKLDEGYELYGRPVLGRGVSGYTRYAQAVVKYEHRNPSVEELRSEPCP